MPPPGARLVQGTRLEPIARRAWDRVRRTRPDDRNATYDRQSFEVMARVLGPGSSGIDVGAHDGLYLAELVRLAPQGRHWAFEPIPHLAAALTERFPTVEVHAGALGDRPGPAAFRFVEGAPQNSSFMRRPWDPPVVDDFRPITVEVERLDDVVPADHRVEFVKIDVEGTELEVLRGAEATLRRSRPFIAFELSWNPHEVVDLLVGCGLEVSVLATWLAGGAPLDRAAFLDEALSGRTYCYLAHPPR